MDYEPSLPEDDLQDNVESRVQHLISGWKDLAKIKSVQGVRFATLNLIRSIIPEVEVPLVRLIEVFDALHLERGQPAAVSRFERTAARFGCGGPVAVDVPGQDEEFSLVSAPVSEDCPVGGCKRVEKKHKHKWDSWIRRRTRRNKRVLRGRYS